MRKSLFTKMTSIVVTVSLVCSLLTLVATDSTTVKAAESVYDFQYGGGIMWNAEDELPTFAPITATKENPMDAFVANDTMGKSDNCDQDPYAEPVKYAMVTLQGIVNRDRPQILIHENREEGQDVWPTELVGEGLYRQTTSYVDMIEKYKGYIKGMVVYDSRIPATMNVATSIAGAEDYIAVDETLANELIRRNMGLEVKVNLKNEPITDTLSAYNYLYDNYYKTGKLNKRLLIGLDPMAHYPYNRDLAVATKSAVLWLEPNNDEERAILDKFYDDATPGVTYNLGWWPSEDSGICYATKKGVASVPSDWFENMTVYMAEEKKLNIPEVPAKPELENKIYVALAVSDGDNTAYNEHVMRIRWGESSRQKYPISWTISPALYYCAPQMLNYYHETAGKDMLICGPSGFGYTKATRWRYKDGFLEKYMDSTNKVFEKTGLNVVTLWDRISEECYDEFSSGVNSLLGVAINDNGFNDTDASWPDAMYNEDGSYRYYPQWGEIAYKNDTPILGLGWPFGYASGPNCSTDMYNALADLANGYDGSKPVFRLAQFVAWDAKVEQINSVADRLNETYPGKFEFVRADHLFMLANEYNNIPYNLALQQETIASNTDGGSDAANANDGSISTGWSDSSSENKWYEVDLGSPSRITRYVLKNAETGYYDNSQNTKSYTFEYSVDGLNWDVAEAVNDNAEDIIYSDFKDSITARYVRINIKDAGSDGVARIQDLEVYGNPIDITADQLRDLENDVKAMEAANAFCENDKWNQYQSALTAIENLLTSDKNDKDNQEDYRKVYNDLLNVIGELAHVEVIDEEIGANCEQTGLTSGKHCSVCGEIMVAQEVVEKTEHTKVVDESVPATCTEPGKTEGSHCSVCGLIIDEQEEVSSLGGAHKEVFDAATEPTCTKNGLTEGSHCSECNAVLTEQHIIAALGHTVVVDEGVPATCTESGKTEGSHCSVCGVVIDAQEEIAALGGAHKEVLDPAIEPTCTKNGLTEGSHCSECNAVLKEQHIIAAPGHTEAVAVKGVPATCTESGKSDKIYCTVCDEVIAEQKVIDPLGHTEVIDKAVAPSCTNTGLTEGSHCSVCNKVIVSQNTIPQLNHIEVTDQAVAATCTQTGLTSGTHCSLCNEVFVAQQTVEATGHTYAIINENASTYFEAGYTGDKICSVCNTVISQGTKVAKKQLKKPIVKVTAGKKRFKVKYQKVTDATGFEISYKRDKKTYKKTFSSTKTVTKTVKSLKKGKYEVRVRAFVKVGLKKAYSAWTTKKTIKVK